MGFVFGAAYKNEISFNARTNSHILIKFELDDNSDMLNMLGLVQGHQVKGQSRFVQITFLAKFDLKETQSLKLFSLFQLKLLMFSYWQNLKLTKCKEKINFAPIAQELRAKRLQEHVARANQIRNSYSEISERFYSSGLSLNNKT